MILRMFLYLAFLVAGAMISGRFLQSSKIVHKLDKLQLMALVFLLFIMGVKIGGNEQVINNLGEIGLAALAVALSSVFFSIIGVWSFRHLRALDRRGEKS